MITIQRGSPFRASFFKVYKQQTGDGKRSHLYGSISFKTIIGVYIMERFINEHPAIGLSFIACLYVLGHILESLI